VLDLLFELREAEGSTLVLVTHDEKVASRSDRRIRLEGGRVAHDPEHELAREEPGA
jgi:putative ABC transport system ATP-binding protein